MHIPDWDERFLTRFDPASFVAGCASAGVDAVMVYCNSHVGLCYWPTVSGQMHAGLRGRDIVADQVSLLRERGIAACAYYSGPVFNGWAYREHPEWRIEPSSRGGMAGPGSRYGVVCPNNPQAMEFMLRQVDELAGAYEFDAFFFDMVFWTSVCVCESCRARYRAEWSAEIPERVDWFGAEWCRFQAARERWLLEAFVRLRERVRAHCDIPVFLNGGIIKFDWWAGAGHDLMHAGDLLGGDFHHQSVLPALQRLTPSVMQYMKAVSAYGGGASLLMPVQEQKAHALAATAVGGQFMAIDAVAPDGSVSAPVYERLAEVFAAMEPYREFLGVGDMIAEVGVYASQAAAVDFADNGLPLDKLAGSFRMSGQPSPHSAAVEGTVRALKSAHIPFTVLSRADLGRLADIPVVVLPNVLRMDEEEIDAFRRYVAEGGRLYASGNSSRVTTRGTRHPDFLLADVFGCRFGDEHTASVTYLKPNTAELAASIAPVAYVAHGEPDVNQAGFDRSVTALRVTAAEGTRILATVSLPYGDGRGNRDDERWASIHNSPPWTDTTEPAVLANRFGAGLSVYSAMDIEATAEGSLSAAPQLFVALVRSLLGREPRVAADAPPSVWLTAFHDHEVSRVRVCVLNHPSRFPALPVPQVSLRVSPPAHARFRDLHAIGSERIVPFEIDADGVLHTTIEDLEVFEMLAATYEIGSSATDELASESGALGQPDDSVVS
ncbi:alpha-L-fucosidase [Phytohabitans kaempferiae]|uniref:Alpha-L-fucosidase n=1 Tax=Phytohabitans kaempferiae TaxID=1620943 RepID=A0ABV6MB67_9ACTN